MDEWMNEWMNECLESLPDSEEEKSEVGKSQERKMIDDSTSDCVSPSFFFG